MRIARTVAAFTGATLLLTGCASYGVDPGAEGDTGPISYWMWDAAQLPAYQQCATDFSTVNPDIEVQIEQFGWDDYWNKLFTGFVSNSAPDVFVDHTSRYGEFAARGLIEPIDEQVEAADIDLDAYVTGSPELWIGPDGKRYGLPKDFDTVGIFYNKAMADEAGLTAEQMNQLTWNPDDGGTYEQVIAHLTVDGNGVRGDEPGFDKGDVVTYGLGLENSGNGFGQTQWSYLTQTTGWTYMDKPAWGTKFNYDDPRFQQTIAWWRGLIDKGFMPSLASTVGGSLDQQMQANRYAMMTNGSWNIANYGKLQGIELSTAPTPIGPDGHRAAMQNSLADSISTSSQNKGAAWKWVEYLASPACQDVVAQGGIVMPALKSTNEASKAKLSETGMDISAFTVQFDEETSFPYPEALNANELDSVMGTAMDNVMNFSAEPDSLTAVNERVDEIFTK